MRRRNLSLALRPSIKTLEMADATPEARHPAEKEDIDTIIAGSDGRDYVVEVVEGVKKWVPYLPEADDVVVIDKILPKIDLPVQKSPQKPAPAKKGPNKYQIFVSEMTKKLKEEQPNLQPSDRISIIKQLWVNMKS